MKYKLLQIGLIFVVIAGMAAGFFWDSRAASSAEPLLGDRRGSTVLQADEVYLPIVVQHRENAGCDAIQAAIDALPEAGGQVLVSSGTFTCTAPIVIARNHVDLRGQGSATVLYLADGANSPVLVVGDPTTPLANYYHHIRISDLSIDGNRANQTQECWGGPCDRGGYTYIRNNGVTLRGVSDVVLERISVYRARSGGLVTEKGCRRLTVSQFTAADNHFDGLAAYETENSVFTDLHLHDNPYAGLSLDIQFNHNIVSGAVMTDNGKQGIFMRDARDNLFSDIQIRGSGEQGLFLAQVDTDASKPAAGNTFHGLVVADSAGPGMRVNDLSCTNNLVVAAQFINNQECISEAEPGLVESHGTICR